MEGSSIEKDDVVEEEEEENLLKDGRRFSCFHCGVVYPDILTLRYHIKNEHLGKYRITEKYLCPNCPYSAANISQIEAHMFEELQRKCQLCDFFAENEEDLAEHTSTHTSDQMIFSCPTFDLTSFPGEGKQSSTQAEKSFGHLFRNHNKSNYAKERSYSCNECPYQTSYKTSLKVHIRARHDKARDYHCPYCEVSLTRKHVLMDHIAAVHFRERPFACKLCNYSAPVASYLRAHVKSKHSNEKPYKCTFCSYSSVRSNTLRGHIRSRHTLDKPHRCPQCDYTSLRPSFLREHILSKHTKERPFVCSHCDYSTVRIANLRSHMVKHLKVKTKQKSIKSLDEEGSLVPIKTESSENHESNDSDEQCVAKQKNQDSFNLEKKIVWKQDSTTQTPCHELKYFLNKC